MLTIIDNQLIAIKDHKDITLCTISENDRVVAMAQQYGCSKALAFLSFKRSLPIGKLLTQRTN